MDIGFRPWLGERCAQCAWLLVGEWWLYRAFGPRQEDRVLGLIPRPVEELRRLGTDSELDVQPRSVLARLAEDAARRLRTLCLNQAASASAARGNATA